MMTMLCFCVAGSSTVFTSVVFENYGWRNGESQRARREVVHRATIIDLSTFSSRPERAIVIIYYRHNLYPCRWS